MIWNDARMRIEKRFFLYYIYERIRSLHRVLRGFPLPPRPNGPLFQILGFFFSTSFYDFCWTIYFSKLNAKYICLDTWHSDASAHRLKTIWVFFFFFGNKEIWGWLNFGMAIKAGLGMTIFGSVRTFFFSEHLYRIF